MFIKTWWQEDAAPPRQHRTLVSLQWKTPTFPHFTDWTGQLTAQREKHTYLCVIAGVDGGFMSDYLFSSYLFVGFWFQHFMVQSSNPGWRSFIWFIYLLYFAYFSIYSCLHVGVGKAGDAWLLMKAGEGENTAAAKHAGHFGCQLVRVTAFGSNSSVTLYF